MMLDRLLFTALAVLLLLGPLAWRLWRCRLADRGLALRAAVDAALRNALGGESFVAVEAIAATPWRRGRVILSAPRGWDFLVKAAWDPVIAALPAGYELVIRAGRRP